ncbi:MAG TPA: MHYT domain-containing protein, partial [Phenylobacterium sp.]
MLSVLTCIFVEHDLRLVLVAALVCATACSAAFGFHLRSLRATATPTRWAWMALTGLVAGSGVWATHFIAMLAYQPNLPIGYEVWLTVASLLVAVIGMGVGFAVPAIQPTRVVAAAGGALTGLSVAALHFIGIAAVRAQVHIEWDYAFVVASILIGVAAAAGAFYARTRLTGRFGWIVPAVLLLLGIVGLHFTAMAAVRLVPDPTLAMPKEVMDRGALALATVALAGAILAAAGSLIWMERLGRRNTLIGQREALDALSAALAFYGPDGRLQSWNRSFAGLMTDAGADLREGIMRGELVEWGLKAGWRPETADDLARQDTALRAGVRPPALDLTSPDGRWLRYEVFVSPDGGSATVMTDITEEREATRALAEARDAAEAANRAKGQFLANMSHEIRTPLNGVLGVADVLAGTTLTGEQRELVGVIRTSGSLLNALLTDLLDLARVEAGAAELRPEPTSLAELTESVRGLYAARAEQKSVALRVEMAPDAGVRVTCDALRLRQVLGNLVSNAVKFTDVGEVAIRVSRGGERVTFAVRDTGLGFDEADKATLFGRFQRADESSTRKHGGAGLGLAICREYVALMGGELDCTSAPGVGSTFAFSLDLPALPALAAPAAEPVAASPGRFRVLVVDDNEINRKILGMILDSAGIEHDEAEDGRAAVEAASTGGFDAVLMDIQMPVMDGLEATRRIRAWETDLGRPRMPILIVSANGLQEH